MYGAERLAGNCSACGTPLDRAVVREIRHYEETRLLEVTCGRCERQFLAIAVENLVDAVQVEDVAAAAEQLAAARSLADLFAPGDLDFPDAA
jgi:coenzyme F420-reducing hydrogenase delta subunit